MASVLQRARQPHVVTNLLSVSCRLQCHVPSPHGTLAGLKLPEVPGPCSPIQGRAVSSAEYPTPREQAYRQLKRFYSQRPSTKTAAGAPPTRQQCLLIVCSRLASALQHVQQPLTSPGPLHRTVVLSSCATQQGRDAQTVHARLPPLLHLSRATRAGAVQGPQPPAACPCA